MVKYYSCVFATSRVSIEELVAYLEFLVLGPEVVAYKMTCTDWMFYVLLLFGDGFCLSGTHVRLPRRCKVANPDLFNRYMKVVYRRRGGVLPQPFWSSGDFESHPPR